MYLYGGHGAVINDENGTHVFAYDSDESDFANSRYIVVQDHDYQALIKYALQFASVRNGVVEGQYQIFGEHNKPSGTYTGNGSATRRTVDTGAINGSLLYVVGNNGSALVTASGAICISTGGTVTYLKQSEAKFLSGVLTLATTNSILNANGQNMSYHAK